MIEYFRSTSDYETGTLVSRTLYEPWRVARYQTGSNITDYGFTGQMREGDVYFYYARWYDPQLGRFMQVDTLVPFLPGHAGLKRTGF
jgi:RHS repeat-associated protein